MAGPTFFRGRPLGLALAVLPLITHAEVDRSATRRAVWRLIHFWAQLLDE
ncbi:MAG TPA: hypothetical protein VF921_21565 [Vicinamibacterales bacterium]